MKDYKIMRMLLLIVLPLLWFGLAASPLEIALSQNQDSSTALEVADTVQSSNASTRLELWSDVHGSNIRTPDGKLNITDLGLVAGNEFNVKVNVTDAGPINVFGLTVVYDFYQLGSRAGVLDVVNAFLQGGLFDPDNPPAGCDITVPVARVNQPPGVVLFTAGINPTTPSCPGTVDGTGILLTITFRVSKEGSTTIEIVETATTIAGVGQTGSFSVPYTARSAYFRNKPGVPPVADFSYAPASPVVGDVIGFNATTSFDPDNSTLSGKGIKRFAWSFGDGSYGTGPVEDHLFALEGSNIPIYGNFSVTLAVWDFNSDLAMAKTVVVNVRPPSLHDVAVSMSLSRSSLSPGDMLNVTVTVVNRGNSDESIGLVVRFDYQGSTILLNETGVLLSPGERITRIAGVPTGLLAPRSYTVTAEAAILGASDQNPDDNVRMVSFVILTTGQSPFASFTYYPGRPVVGEFVSFDGSGSFDPDGYITTWTWSFGDGTTGSASYPYISHAYSRQGLYEVALTVTDNSGLTATARRSLDVGSRPAHDVAAGFIDFYPETPVSGQFVTVQVGLENRGNTSETVDLTVFFDSQVAATLTGFVLNPCPPYCYPTVAYLLWDTLGVAPGEYTISVTVFLASDEHPDDNTLVDGSITILPAPIVAVTPDSGGLGTKVTVQGSGFPLQPALPGISLILVSFDDEFLGFTIARDGEFSFTFNLPHAEPGFHEVKVLDGFSGTRAAAVFEVLPDSGGTAPGAERLSVGLDVGVLYFPGQTVTVFVLTSLDGLLVGPDGVVVEVFLVRPDGSRVALTVEPAGPGLFRASYALPEKDAFGTYALVATAELESFDGSALASFEVQPSWLARNAPRLGLAASAAGLVGVVALAWRKGYLRRGREQDAMFL